MSSAGAHVLPLAAAALATLLAPAVQAALYRCPSDRADGGTIITNLLRESDAGERGCELLRPRSSSLDSTQAPAIPRRSAPARRATAADPSPSPSPEPTAHRVAASTQRVRDDERRVILETELRIEQETLARVRQRVQAPTTDNSQRREAEQALERHAANIAALQREIARVH